MDNPTPKHGHAPIKMRQVKDRDRMHSPGDYFFDEVQGNRVLWIAVPGRELTLAFGIFAIGRDGWLWDGNIESPTLTEPVHVESNWRGSVRSGFLVEALGWRGKALLAGGRSSRPAPCSCAGSTC